MLFERGIICTGWCNGSPNNRTGAGYGIRISLRDRDSFLIGLGDLFLLSWMTVRWLRLIFLLHSGGIALS